MKQFLQPIVTAQGIWAMLDTNKKMIANWIDICTFVHLEDVTEIALFPQLQMVEELDFVSYESEPVLLKASDDVLRISRCGKVHSSNCCLSRKEMGIPILFVLEHLVLG